MDWYGVDKRSEWHLVRKLVTLAALLLAQESLATETMYPVPANALDRAHDVIQPGVSEQDSFRLRETYPGTSVVSHYQAFFSRWRSCTDDHPEWSSYEDITGQAPQFVHQLARYWTSQQNDVAVILAVRYVSSGPTSIAVPMNDQQYVTVVRLRVPNAEKQLAELGVSCKQLK
jgi:hypothetical protein